MRFPTVAALTFSAAIPFILFAGCAATTVPSLRSHGVERAVGSRPQAAHAELRSYDSQFFRERHVPALKGEGVSSVGVFHDALAPYGSWFDHHEHGRVFSPRDESYVPYTRGRWVSTSYGLTWLSDAPFGWAVCHYGRWVYDGRWLWVPDTAWAPAWVTWRKAGDVLGWAPLPPRGYRVRAGAFLFVPTARLLHPHVRRFGLPPGRRGGAYRRAVVVRCWAVTPGGHRFPAGPWPHDLRRHGVDPRPKSVSVRRLGRDLRAPRWVPTPRSGPAPRPAPSAPWADASRRSAVDPAALGPGALIRPDPPRPSTARPRVEDGSESGHDRRLRRERAAERRKRAAERWEARRTERRERRERVAERAAERLEQATERLERRERLAERRRALRAERRREQTRRAARRERSAERREAQRRSRELRERADERRAQRRRARRDRTVARETPEPRPERERMGPKPPARPPTRPASARRPRVMPKPVPPTARPFPTRPAPIPSAPTIVDRTQAPALPVATSSDRSGVPRVRPRPGVAPNGRGSPWATRKRSKAD